MGELKKGRRPTFGLDAPMPMTIDDPCEVTGCSEVANWVPKLCVPVLGMPSYEPFEMLLPHMHLCRKHSRLVEGKMLLTKLGRDIATMVMGRKGALPDFARAFVRPVSIMSEEFRGFLKEEG